MKSVHLSEYEWTDFSINTHISTYLIFIFLCVLYIWSTKNNKQAVGIVGKVQFLVHLFVDHLILLPYFSFPSFVALSRFVPFCYFLLYICSFFLIYCFFYNFLAWNFLNATPIQNIMLTILTWYFMMTRVWILNFCLMFHNAKSIF